MAKIQITENDIKQMVLETIGVLLKENYGTCTVIAEWYPAEEMEKYGYTEEQLGALAQQGVIPEDLATLGFDIKKSIDCSAGFNNISGPWCNYGDEPSYGKEYDKAEQLISQIKDEKVKQAFEKCFKDFCEDIDATEGDYEEYEPDWESMHGGPDDY